MKFAIWEISAMQSVIQIALTNMGFVSFFLQMKTIPNPTSIVAASNKTSELRA